MILQQRTARKLRCLLFQRASTSRGAGPWTSDLDPDCSLLARYRPVHPRSTSSSPAHNDKFLDDRLGLNKHFSPDSVLLRHKCYCNSDVLIDEDLARDEDTSTKPLLSGMAAVLLNMLCKKSLDSKRRLELGATSSSHRGSQGATGASH